MPDPNAHTDDMKSPVKPETMPSLWWLEPWTFAVEQWQARAKFYAYWKAAEHRLADAGAECYAQANRIIALYKELEDEQKKAKYFEQRWLEANEALTKEQGDHAETQEKLNHEVEKLKAQIFWMKQPEKTYIKERPARRKRKAKAKKKGGRK